jgi:hypothetical protein
VFANIIDAPRLGLLVDPSIGELFVGGENGSLAVNYSTDHGATFAVNSNYASTVSYFNWAITSDATQRALWVGGTGGTVHRVTLPSWSSASMPGFLSTATPSSRSMYGASCTVVSDVVDSVDGSLAVSHNFGFSLGTVYPVLGPNQTTSVDPARSDVLVTYSVGPSLEVILLDVYENELSCGPHVAATVNDGRDFARYGQMLNYLVTLNGPVINGAVSLNTPGNGLDLASATWTCVGSDITAICPSSDGIGPALGTVSLPAGTSMNWIVSVPVSSSTTDDTIELDVAAPGATSGSDVNELVIFRDGFNVTNSDGTRVHQ